MLTTLLTLSILRISLPGQSMPVVGVHCPGGGGGGGGAPATQPPFGPITATFLYLSSWSGSVWFWLTSSTADSDDVRRASSRWASLSSSACRPGSGSAPSKSRAANFCVRIFAQARSIHAESTSPVLTAGVVIFGSNPPPIVWSMPARSAMAAASEAL